MYDGIVMKSNMFKLRRGGKFLALSTLMLAAGIVSARLPAIRRTTCDWASPGEATVSSTAHVTLAHQPFTGIEFNWVVQPMIVHSHFYVSGPPLPAGQEAGCPWFPSLYSAEAHNDWEDTVGGTKHVMPSELWRYVGDWDDRDGTGWLVYTPPDPDEKYVRTLDMYVFEQAYFEPVPPEEAQGGA